MFALAFIIGIYSYLIFALGIAGWLYKGAVILASFAYLLILIYIFRNRLEKQINNFRSIKFIKEIQSNKLFGLGLSVIVVQAIVNLVGVLGPEISFDSLWYHLTLPKIYIQSHAIFHISGANLFYADTPKLTEMLYTAALILTNDTVVKLIHFAFGILVLIVIYKISRKFLSREFAILSAVIFYGSLVVGWETITAYIDLSRTFFELMAVWGFLEWLDKHKIKTVVLSGLMLGLAITTKLIAVESLIVFFVLFSYDAFVKKQKMISIIQNFSLFLMSALVVPLPWFIFSFINTGNPFYPYITTKLADSGNSLMLPNFPNILVDLYNFFLRLNDPISPVYLVVLPLIIIGFKKFNLKLKILTLYSLIAFVIWYLVLENRGSRFMLPYLPIVSILAAYVISQLRQKYLKVFLIIVIIFVGLISIGYRSEANAKFIPVIIGRESKAQFLTKYLNFSYGDFYDTDGYFQKHIKTSDRVLLIGFHNLYYVNFPFVDSSWVKKGDGFNYIAVQNTFLPKRFSDWHKIYYNSLTKVALYAKDGKKCAY